MQQGAPACSGHACPLPAYSSTWRQRDKNGPLLGLPPRRLPLTCELVAGLRLTRGHAVLPVLPPLPFVPVCTGLQDTTPMPGR